MTDLQIDGVTGFRDVGAIPTVEGVIRSGMLFRSGHLAGLDEDGRAEVRARVRRIVDLRADDEVAEFATTVDGVVITRLPLYLGSPRSFFLEDYSLGEIYAHLLSESAPLLVDAMRIIAEGNPTLVHCAAGKDRTGVTIALALAAVGADREAIVADYARTGDLIAPEQRRATAQRLARKYPQSRHAAMLATESPAEVMRDALTNLDAEWGSAAQYLTAHGLTDHELSALRTALVEPAAPTATRTSISRTAVL